MSDALRIARLSVTLSGRKILSGIDLAVRPGELVAIIGPNGSGKTTLLRAVTGLVPAEGAIDVNGASLSTMPLAERARRIAYLPQGHVFYWPIPVADVVGLGRLPRGAGADLSEADTLAVERALAATGTSEYAGRAVTTLSGGENARVAIARVLATEAPLILADEPTASLDPRYQLATVALLRSHADAGGAVMAVLHDLALAARSADRIVVLDGGRIVADGPPRSVLTPERLADTFGVTAEIVEVRGIPVVVPLSART